MIEALIVGLIGLLGVIVAYFRGRSGGKQEQKGKQAEKVVQDVSKAKKVADDVARTDADSRRDELRKYTDG